ncbi:MAG: hypothetical protein HYW50_01010 [Candidatus Diapherotrites archaeon]|nr:hypothetical protein [Candidatus Diapherotrites archaeon]
MNARTIANLTGSLDESQICLTVSSVFEDSFEKSGASGGYGGVLNFKAQQLQAKLWVICDSGNSVDNSVNNAGLSDEMPGCSGTGDSKTVCYVSVVSTN